MIRLIKRLLPARLKVVLRNLIFGSSPAALHPNEVARRERAKQLESAQSLDEVRNTAKELGFTYFLDYDHQIPTKRREFLAAVNYFGQDLRGRVVLDVGPGTADSLDFAKELGASETLFIEEEPFFVRFATLKGHVGVEKNYTYDPFFPREWKEKIDFLYTKGSINCEWVNEQQRLRDSGDPAGYFDFDAWIRSLLNLMEPRSGSAILVPAMSLQASRIVDATYDLDTYYWCPDVARYRESFFCTTLVAHGFQIVENVQGFTQEKAFPFAFYYSNGKSITSRCP